MVDFGPAAEERGVPRNVDAERSVIGAILLDAEAIADVSQVLKAEDFYYPTHQVIYQAVIDVHDERNQADLLLVQDMLSRRQGG